jgi:2-polyprenyl-6-methoxyphenol hydroxylase-like FAD-dependent oxidoreductase
MTRRAAVDTRWDVIVVGARPAGAATALLLARQGLQVLVVDRGSYGADAVSTHALMRAGVLQLSRWGVLPALQAAGTPAVRCATFVYGDERLCVPVKPRDGVEALYAPRRTLLDRVLVDAARAAGAEFRFGTRAVGISLDGRGRVTGLETTDASGGTQCHHGEVVVGADGVHSALAGFVRAECTRMAASSSAMAFGYWEGLPVDGYRWYYRPGLSAGAIPTNGGRTCVFVSAPAWGTPASSRADLARDYLAVLGRVAPDLAEAIPHAQLDGRLRVFPGERGFLRRAAGPGWALVGDAGYFRDPLTAHGLTDALVDAEYLAGAILAGRDAALSAYATDRDRRALVMFEVTERIASFAWTLDEVRGLHKRLASAMNEESAGVLSRDGLGWGDHRSQPFRIAAAPNSTLAQRPECERVGAQEVTCASRASRTRASC